MKIGGERFLREDIKNIKVAVIGDIMLDRYISGNVERISPEAPVPINLVKSQRNVLGGAANTAANLSSLGGQVFIAGMRGNDRDGATIKLCKAFKEKYPDKNIWLWTGFTWETIENKEVLEYLDVLVDGQFKEDLHDPRLKWCGSSNQRVIDVKKSLKEDKIVLYESEN